MGLHENNVKLPSEIWLQIVLQSSMVKRTIESVWFYCVVLWKQTKTQQISTETNEKHNNDVQ